MKNKLFSKMTLLGFAFAGLLLIGNNLVANDETTPIIQPPNSATCYSTYSDPGWLQKGKNFWRCGSCVNTKGVDLSDPGICYF